jgi:DNA modification methylase
MATANKEALESLMRDVQTGSEDLAAMLAGLAEQEGIVPKETTPGQGGDEFDATPEEKGPTRAGLGDLWIIGGKHRLLVGDNTTPDNVKRLMGGKRVGLCFTSPPYAQQREYGDAAKEKCADWFGLMCGTFANVPMTDDGQILVNLGLIHRDGEWIPYWDGWIEWMRSQGWRRFGWYVWDQGSGLPGDWSGRLAPSHEFIWHFNREAVKPDHCVPKDPKSIRDRTGDAAMRMGAATTQRATSGKASLNTHKIPDSVIRIQRQCGRIETGDYHPAVYPVALPSFAIDAWPSDVYDPFLGSGTTLIAAHRLNRTCYGCELEPRYADVILRRSEAEGLTVEKAQ